MKRFMTLLLAGLLTTGYSMNEKFIYGYVEKATLVEKNLTLHAKLDTGAKSASLNAIDIKEIEENGHTYILFKVPTAQGSVLFKKEYRGKVQIKVRAGESVETQLKSIKRPVVEMRIRLGDKERIILVNLTNRKRFNYPLLLGRDALIAFSGIIDPSLAFTVKNE
jgi:hypothetical protein